MNRSKRVGVVIGRFQVAKLHQGHRHLLSHVRDHNDDLLVILGSARSFPTARDPLSFEMRRAMILADFPSAHVLPQIDFPSDQMWSEEIDAMIGREFPYSSATLYGSRDSFMSRYHGRNSTEEVPAVSCASGTHYRVRAANKPLSSEAFRRGIVYSQTVRAPIAYPAVDVAIIHPDRREVLLAGKNIDCGKLRFVGGFFDPTVDTSFERAASREAREETSGHLELADFRYVGSQKMDDWRYRNTPDGIVTAFFVATYVFGPLQAGDDIDVLRWVPYEMVDAQLVETHRPLGDMFNAFIGTIH